jgi:hypothetical protein
LISSIDSSNCSDAVATEETLAEASEDAFFASEEPSWALRAATIIASEVSAMRFVIEPSRLIVPANSEASSSTLARIPHGRDAPRDRRGASIPA